MLIDVISDTVCPWCFIGKRRLERALKQRPGVVAEIRWRPFQLNPDMPPGGMPRADYLAAKFGGVEQARQRYRAVEQAGAGEGIGFRFDDIAQMPNSLDSHRLIRWAGGAGRQDEVVELLFRRYFLEGRDIGDPAVLVQIAEEAGMDGGTVARLLAEGADVEAVRGEDKVARDMGISGVPCFVIDRQYAISGAQDPAVFHQVFDVAATTAESAAGAGR